MNTEMENGTQMTLEECMPGIFRKPTVGASGSPVLPKELIFLQKKDISQWQTGEQVFRWWMEDENVEGQMELSEFMDY